MVNTKYMSLLNWQERKSCIKNDDKLRIDFEYEKFKKVFEEEMSKNAQ